jgi:mitochondrial ATPase complex subunit ATP10
MSLVCTHRPLRSYIHSVFARHASSSSTDAGPSPAATGTKERGTLSLLQRPLGVTEPPQSRAKTWSEKRDELLDQDIRMAKRRHLCVLLCFYVLEPLTRIPRIKEASRGYFEDLNATRRHGGKTWIAPRVMIREEVSTRFYYVVIRLTQNAGCIIFP